LGKIYSIYPVIVHEILSHILAPSKGRKFCAVINLLENIEIATILADDNFTEIPSIIFSHILLFHTGARTTGGAIPPFY